MLPEHYEIRIGNDPRVYLFESSGPKGVIEKAVVFSATALFGLYNLGFGDVTMEGEIDDLAVSDNGDMQKVLATIASIVVDFTYKNPDAMIVAAGSTPSRTRLYRMGIASHYGLLAADFQVFGFNAGKWEEFTKGKDYEAFYVKRK
jgi:hypothetical protein